MAATSYTVGVFLTAKKLQEPQSIKTFELAKQDNLHLVTLDLTKPVADQGKFDLILCKLNSEISKQKEGDKDAIAIMNHIQEYTQSNPDVPVIDPIQIQISLMCRLEMEKMLDRVRAAIPELAPVRSVVLEQRTDASLVLADFPFPAIAKSMDAGGSNQAHEMAIVFNIGNLDHFPRPAIVQQFHNHNAIIYKVYVTFPSVSVDKRASLPNFKASAVAQPQSFNSQAFSALYGVMEEVKPPSTELMDRIAACVHQDSGLTLFGFDLIYCVELGRYTIIDINFYPGYLGIPSFPQDLVNLMKAKIDKRL